MSTYKKIKINDINNESIKKKKKNDRINIIIVTEF